MWGTLLIAFVIAVAAAAIWVKLQDIYIALVCLLQK